ncbi:hypothetical protein, partial [Priestia aryabhattai]
MLEENVRFNLYLLRNISQVEENYNLYLKDNIRNTLEEGNDLTLSEYSLDMNHIDGLKENKDNNKGKIFVFKSVKKDP